MSESDDHLREVGIQSEEVFRGRLLTLRRDQVRLPNGALTTREYVIHPGAVMIIPILDDGRIVMERQFRYPVGQAMIEFPAGKLDAGEVGLTCAVRELREETGYCAGRWARAGVLHPVIGYGNEVIEIWFAKDLVAGERDLDDGEFLDVFPASVQELDDWVRDGRITDGKTLGGMLWLHNCLAGRWPLNWHRLDASASST